MEVKNPGGAKGKNKGVSADDVQISKAGSKNKTADVNSSEGAQNANRKSAKKEQSKQSEADATEAETAHSNRQEASEQKIQESVEQDAQGFQEQRSDSQSAKQEAEAEIKQQTKADIQEENVKADNHAQNQRARETEARQTKAAAELKEETLVAPASGRSTKRASKAGHSSMSRWSPEELARFKAGKKKGKVSSNVLKSMEDAATNNGPTIRKGTPVEANTTAQGAPTTRKGSKAKTGDADTDPVTISNHTSGIRAKAKAKAQAQSNQKALDDTQSTAQKGQQQKADNTQAAQEADANLQAQRKKEIAKDHDQDALVAQEHQSDSQSAAQSAEADAGQQQKHKEAETQSKEADDAETAMKNEADVDSAKQQQNMEEQQRLSALQGQAATINALFGGLGSVAGGGFKFLATEQQALQKESEARQKSHEYAAQSWSEWMQLHQDQIKNCQSKIDEINRIHFDTLKSLSRS